MAYTGSENVTDYLAGDLSFRLLNTTAVAEGSNLYFTTSRVLSTLLTGLAITGGTISATDSVLQGFGKLQNQINTIISGYIISISGTSNRITASTSLGNTTIDISSSYVGQSSITTLGTIGSGTWHANPIDLSNYASGTLQAAQFPALTGAITTTAGSLSTSITNQSVTYSKIQNLTSNLLLLGRYSTGAGSAQEITIGNGLSLDTSTGVLSTTDAGGTVTSVSVVSANGFAGTVATSTTTPAITISTTVTGLLKGNGTAISAATAGTDYSAGTSALATGILKSTTSTGALSIAVAADFPTLNQNTTGNAATATALQNARTIGGVSFDGTANIVPQTIQSNNESTDTTCFLLFITASGTQSLQPKNNTGLTYNSSTNSVGATTFVGALSGNASTATTAAAWTTARNLAGNSVDGSANVAFLNKFIVQGTTDAGLSGAQFLGSLGTGILKNTTTTGVLSIAVAGDFPTLNQNTTGNAATATALQNARTIGAVSFDGTANIVPQTIQTVDDTSDTTCFLLFGNASGSQTSGQQPKTNSTLAFNASTQRMSVTDLTVTNLGASQLMATDSAKGLTTLSTLGYPSLTEISYVKGVTSAIQTQLNAKASSGANTDITSVVLVNTAGLNIKDTDASHFLSINVGSNLTANRSLTLTPGDANRTITLRGDINTGDSFTTSGAFSLTLTTTASTNVTLPTTGTLATLAGTENLSNKTFLASFTKGLQFAFMNDSDTTKLASFIVNSSQSASTQTTHTLPSFSSTLAALNSAPTFTGNITTTSNFLYYGNGGAFTYADANNSVFGLPSDTGSFQFKSENGVIVADLNYFSELRVKFFIQDGFTVYSMGNIVGTVSQSSGTPTGAIIERGSNANGEYTKFADGTMFCRARNSTTPVANTLTSSNHTWPATFTAAPYMGCSIDSSVYGTTVTAMTVRNSSTTGYTQTVLRSNTTATIAEVIAMGYWF